MFSPLADNLQRLASSFTLLETGTLEFLELSLTEQCRVW